MTQTRPWEREVRTSNPAGSPRVTATPRLLSIHPGMVAVIKHALRQGPGVTIRYGGQGTTTDRPWGVWMPPHKERP